MKLFRGLDKTDYQDVLRAIGHFLDERSVSDFRILLHDDGLVIQLLPAINSQSSSYSYQTFLLTDNDIQQLLRRSYERRTAPERPVAHVAH